jgi:predicted regulator of Ras-like GTPase activity (Roadblock/LC7/MglB family)
MVEVDRAEPFVPSAVRPAWPAAPLPAPAPAPDRPPLRLVEEPDMSKQRDLDATLRGFCAAVDDVHGAVLATRDGLTIASASMADGTAARVAAMAATVQAVAEQTVAADGAGVHTMVRAGDGCLVVYPAGPHGVLALQTAAKPNVGLVQVHAPEAADELAELLG